jgi:hypothetical protein
VTAASGCWQRCSVNFRFSQNCSPIAPTPDQSSILRSAKSYPTSKHDLDIHIVMDNYATHKTPLIRNWFAKRPQWHVHLTPTGASWLNQVERFFALLTDRQIRRGVHRSVPALEAAISEFISQHNGAPKPFAWTKSADDILAAIERFCTRTIAIQNAMNF